MQKRHFFIELCVKDVLTLTDDAMCSEINKHLLRYSQLVLGLTALWLSERVMLPMTRFVYL